MLRWKTTVPVFKPRASTLRTYDLATHVFTVLLLHVFINGGPRILFVCSTAVHVFCIFC